MIRKNNYDDTLVMVITVLLAGLVLAGSVYLLQDEYGFFRLFVASTGIVYSLFLTIRTANDPDLILEELRKGRR